MNLALKMPVSCMVMLMLTVALSADLIAQEAKPKAEIPNAP